jgi:hypothetical protein
VKIKCREPGAINCSIEFFFGDVGFFITFEGEDCVREDEEDPDDPKTGKAGKRDKDEEDKDGDKKGESEDSDLAGEYEKTEEKKVVWRELKVHMKCSDAGGKGKGGAGQLG